MAERFQGKVVLITGAGGGIGNAVVEQFASEGARIVVTDRNEECMADLKSICGKISSMEFLPGDLSDATHCDQLASRVREIHGRLDVVVNNAGVMRRGNILDTSDDDWGITMSVNVESVFRICRSAIAI